ncbi:FAD/NAD(P)-binding protein [Mucilaginibacter sp. UR6-11]|uniref:FAD/NAD(P)-binding protein n=1 Tax=Mucilaginibacter sp. UR6-11 TaxID=1435644 RepID=UPI001E462FFC|nr:FAD/NAD(P)-binding protein [Mucilaginibacter sp. UR6-11]MCC8424771.1 FAD/NAD(P)-binding protein [Mucilaginibacter sp. UR6-11]
MENIKRIAIIGGGPSGLFMFKRLVDANRTDLSITIFEKNEQLGKGMPYSTDGARDEHITNVSGNEIPELVTSVTEWIETAPAALLNHYQITPQKYNDFKVLPRLLFGQYLVAQFELLLAKATAAGILDKVYFDSRVTDITDHPEQQKVTLQVNGEKLFEYDQVIICTGHRWPAKYEGTVTGYYDSPYPPAKLAIKTNAPVAVKGSSLTAIDAIRTLARANGTFTVDDDGVRRYRLADDNADFKLIMHSREGLLPAVRFHLEDPHLSKEGTLTRARMQAHRKENGGFMSLDYLFEHNFKDLFRDKRPAFYERIKDMDLETFVAGMMDLREYVEPFQLFKAEYAEAERSIKRKESVYWKEVLAILSYSMNYPAKYLSAEDSLRLQKVLMPLISIVIAFVPQSSCEEIMALHQAGVLEIIAVGGDSHVEPGKNTGAVYYYTDTDGQPQAVAFDTFVDCVGQPHLAFEDLPFKSLISRQTVSPARLRFKDAAAGKEALKQGDDHIETDGKGNYYLRVPGIAINDSFQPIDDYGAFNDRIYVMAVPYIGGFNPDYSGLDFCEAASDAIIKNMFN